MPITITRIQTRPSTDIPFFFEIEQDRTEYENYLKTKYRDTGKLLGFDRTMSNDRLTATSNITWESQEAFAEFFADSYCVENFLSVSAEYEQTHGIKTETLDKENGFVIPTWKQLHAKDYFKNVEIPDHWDTLEDFVDWYCNQRMPLMIPWNAKVIRSDDAVAICLFRKGNFQVEFYIEYPNMYIHKHAHPRMEVITMTLGGGSNWDQVEDTNTSVVWGALTKKLTNGNYHGGDSQSGTGNGFALLAFQRWDNPDEMTSAAVQWKGEILGEDQTNLIRNHYPDAYITDGYADITRKMPKSAAVQWKGGTQGDIQSDLIKSHFPNALIQEGYADITTDK